MKILLSLFLACVVRMAAPAAPAGGITRDIPCIPGAPTEITALIADVGSAVTDGARRAAADGGWTYRFVAPPGAHCALTFTAEGQPAVTAALEGGASLAVAEKADGAARVVEVDVPADALVGSAVRFRFQAGTSPIALRSARLTITAPDANGDGVPDVADRLMGLPDGRTSDVTPRPSRPTTSFQTAVPYAPELAPPTGAVMLYSADPLVYASWANAGYVVQCMGGFRDGQAYATANPGDVQTDRDGRPISVGPGSFYLVPGARRSEAVRQYFGAAIKAGATMVCPEEPEYWVQAGWEDAFKQEWQRQLSAPWRAPDTDLDTRWRAETLKAALETRIVGDVLSEAARANPSVTRAVAIHSPLNYALWGIATPHAQILRLPLLQEVIGQVWTGTARSPVRVGGVRAERSFEHAYLEYSSLAQLCRGSGKRLWFLMDPLEDDLTRTADDYRSNYVQTLAAALMFPEIDSFEVMPWPERIYGHVPASYATVVNTVAGTLGDLWRYPSGAVEAGTAGVGAFVADSMGRQRGEPSPGTMDGFYSLALPFVQRGVPFRVLSMDRAVEPGYLDDTRMILLSYDYVKPTDPAQTRAVADWVRRGGALVLVGGADPYCALEDMPWRRAGAATPTEALLRELGLGTGAAQTLAGPNDAGSDRTEVVARGDGAEHTQRNRSRRTIDLRAAASPTGCVIVRFADTTPGDGFGPYLRSVEVRAGDRLLASFRPGSEIETRMLWAEAGSVYDGEGRYADGGAFWEYRIENLPRGVGLTMTIDVANGFAVSVRPGRETPTILRAVDGAFPRTMSRLRLPAGADLTVSPPPASATALFRAAGSEAPAVWRATVGTGSVTVVGVAPAALSVSAYASRWLFGVARRAFELQRGTFRTSGAFVSRRGPYCTVRTLAREVKLEGRYVDLLAPDLAMREDPVVPARSAGMYQRARMTEGAPRLLAASGRVRARVEQDQLTGFLVDAPAQTDGAARVWRGKRVLQRAMAFTAFGAPVDVVADVMGDTVLLRYRNAAEGVAVRLVWQ